MANQPVNSFLNPSNLAPNAITLQTGTVTPQPTQTNTFQPTQLTITPPAGQTTQTNAFQPTSLAPNGPSADPKGTFDSGFYHEQKYNEIYHNIDLYLSNSGNLNKLNRFHINPAAVLGLHISDTVTDWVVNGSITFMYIPEGSPTNSNTGNSANTNTQGIRSAAIENGETLNSYEFRGDGFDILRVMIVPKSNSGQSKSGVNVGSNPSKWTLSYLFSIYEIEDVNDVPQLEGYAATYLKCLKLKFHDVRYQILKTTNLEYSTAMPKDITLTPIYDSGLANGTQGVLYTGDALRDIFNAALTNPDTGGCSEFELLGGLSWDKGSSQLFYTSPASYSALDDINYVYSNHVSSLPLAGVEDLKINDLCLLHTERSSSPGLIEKIVLTPITDFFKNAGNGKNEPGELQKEHFFVTSHTSQGSESEVLNGFRAPISNEKGDSVDLKTFKYGQIVSYSFVDMSPTINSHMFRSTPVYSVDIGKRQFNIQFKGNDVLTARKTISNSYISNLYKKDAGDIEELFLTTLHKSKKNSNMFPTFSLNGDNEIVRQKKGILDLIYTGLFQNACICFKTYGLTLRESGTFIGIDKTEGCADNDYNNKLYGQWFVVKVDHLFEAGAYMNVIYAVKLHRHDTKKFAFDSLIEV